MPGCRPSRRSRRSPGRPGLSGQVHAAVDRVWPAWMRYSASGPVGPVGDPHAFAVGEVQRPPGAWRPEAYTAEPAVGLPAAGLPDVSMRSTLPARDFGSAADAGLPASPVATSRAPRPSPTRAPRLPVAPFGMPVSTGFGGWPFGEAHDAVVGRRGDVREHQLVLDVARRQHQRGQAAVTGGDDVELLERRRVAAGCGENHSARFPFTGESRGRRAVARQGRRRPRPCPGTWRSRPCRSPCTPAAAGSAWATVADRPGPRRLGRRWTGRSGPAPAAATRDWARGRR